MSDTVTQEVVADVDSYVDVVVRVETCHDGVPLHEKLAYIRDHFYGGDELAYSVGIAKAAGAYSCECDSGCPCTEQLEKQIEHWANRFFTIRKAAKAAQRKTLH